VYNLSTGSFTSATGLFFQTQKPKDLRMDALPANVRRAETASMPI
jgi:hypothetical protein